MAEETKRVMLTESGKKKYEAKLQFLKQVKRPEISERIRTAREFGDISENAEYESAKNDQAFMEGEIAEIENLLKHAEIIKKSDINADEVGQGVSVKLLDKSLNEELTFEIVGTKEADPKNGRISIQSPVGAALEGHGVGDEVDVRSPGGTATWKILSIKPVIDDDDDEEDKKDKKKKGK